MAVSRGRTLKSFRGQVVAVRRGAQRAGGLVDAVVQGAGGRGQDQGDVGGRQKGDLRGRVGRRAPIAADRLLRLDMKIRVPRQAPLGGEVGALGILELVVPSAAAVVLPGGHAHGDPAAQNLVVIALQPTPALRPALHAHFARTVAQLRPLLGDIDDPARVADAEAHRIRPPGLVDPLEVEGVGRAVGVESVDRQGAPGQAAPAASLAGPRRKGHAAGTTRAWLRGFGQGPAGHRNPNTLGHVQSF